MEDKGLLLVVSGPAGVGKGTLCKRLFSQAEKLNLEYSVSVTTRSPRPGEIEGKEYYFRTREEFLDMIANNEFLEWAEFCGNLYGTPLFHVHNVLKQDKTILLEIDIQGAKLVKEVFPHGVFIFIVPPTFTELADRLHGRGTESEEVIALRLAQAVEEMQNINDYDYAVENDEVDVAVEKIKSIIIAEHCRIKKTSS
ncbi:guanylate kinase [Dehalobacter sp. DCM]|uniref:guanylate kinase n=1 Tax=Dehalobacter sp. DCM TaxID=2907827 RepID=UPI003081D18B|nr:guanylate kinase [Dehalobacter sp. DCM]